MILKNTYLLTTSGWCLVQNLTTNKKICGLSTTTINNNNFSSTTITTIKKTNYTGTVYTINKSQLHPETKLLTKKNRLKKIKNIKNIENIKIKHHYSYSGYRVNPIEHDGYLFDTCLIMKIIGYFVECGYLRNKCVIFRNSDLKMKDISKTLNTLNLNNWIGINNRGTLLYSNNKYLYNFLSQFCYNNVQNTSVKLYKYIPRKFLDLDKCYIKWLLSSMLSSSASKDILVTPKNIQSPRFQFITNSSLLTDNLQELAIKLNYYFNTCIIYGPPMKREQYNPLTSKYGNLTTTLHKGIKVKNIIKSKIKTDIYSIHTDKKLKLIIIRNNSKPLFINV